MRIALLALPLLLFGSVAHADDDNEDEDEDVEDVEDVEPTPPPKAKAKAKPKAMPKKPRNELYFRAGVAHVEPRIASGGLELRPTGLASLAAMTEPVAGGIESQPANIIAGIIGFAPAAFGGRIAFETLVGIPQPTKLRAVGDLADKSLAPTAAGIIPTGIPALGPELGEAKAVPPMLTVVLRLPSLGPIRPYIGAGASVLFVTDARITNAVLTEVATPRLEITPAFGVVAQAGIDVHLTGRFYARLDLKELWFQEAESRITNLHVATTIPMLETVEVGSAVSTVRANPIIVQAGVGVTF
jgi:outer membrane protein W